MLTKLYRHLNDTPSYRPPDTRFPLRDMAYRRLSQERATSVLAHRSAATCMRRLLSHVGQTSWATGNPSALTANSASSKIPISSRHRAQAVPSFGADDSLFTMPSSRSVSIADSLHARACSFLTTNEAKPLLTSSRRPPVSVYPSSPVR